jgi:hypothetical protein
VPVGIIVEEGGVTLKVAEANDPPVRDHLRRREGKNHGPGVSQRPPSGEVEILPLVITGKVVCA